VRHLRPTSTRVIRALFVIGLLGAALAVPATAGAAVSYLSNGVIEVGVDLDEGGVITHLAPSGGESVINDYDLGRQVQQSYYSGPEGLCVIAGFGSGWNPVGAGDAYGNPSQVVAQTNDGKTIYVKSVPKQWACNNVPCECTFEHWISLDGRTVHVHNRLTNNRTDHSWYTARSQELPATYTVGTLYRLFTYDGNAPYTNAPTNQVSATLPNAALWTATEGWAAQVTDVGWGLGVFSPAVTTFAGGFHGTPGTGAPLDDATGYISPTRRELLDWNAVYEYDYTLILGTLDEIRGYAVANRPDRRPDFHFAGSRQGWWYIKAHDQGFPLDSGFLRVAVDLIDPQMWRLDQWFSASEVPKLFVRMRHHSQQSQAQLFWRSGGDFSEENSLRFAVKPDDKWHTYILDLAGRPGWQGSITGLRLDPVSAGGEPGGYVDVASISWKQAQRTLRVTTTGAGRVRSEPSGISCPATCSGGFGEGSDVTLVPEAAPGWAFSHWNGACTEDGDCSVTLDEDASVQATFVPARHARAVSLALRRHLVAGGRVTVRDGYVDCRAGVLVAVQRRVGRRWRTVRSTTTGDGGRYAVKLRDRPGRYRVLARRVQVGDHTCSAAISSTRTYRRR
jgi:Divergent InlB B-repeat domain